MQLDLCRNMSRPLLLLSARAHSLIVDAEVGMPVSVLLSKWFRVSKLSLRALGNNPLLVLCMCRLPTYALSSIALLASIKALWLEQVLVLKLLMQKSLLVRPKWFGLAKC